MYYFWFYDEDDAELDCTILSIEDIKEEFNIDTPFIEQDLDEIGYELCETISDAVNFKWEFITE
jgi:hypothetical protein